MAALEKAMQMKQQGATDVQIIESLKQDGVSPKEIEEAISQSKIKSIINMENQQPPQEGTIPQPESPAGMPPETAEIPNQNIPMQPSIAPAQAPQSVPAQQAMPMQETNDLRTSTRTICPSIL